MLGSLNIDKTYQFLLIALAFLLPLTVFMANTVIVVICILWLTSGEYKSKFDQIINNKLMIASILFFCLHVLGLLWTEDLVWGLHIVHKMWYFLLLFPVLYSIVRKDYIKYYIFAFLLAISFTEIVSYLVWFELIEPFKNATLINPTPFMSHISYNPILAFAIYLVGHKIFFSKEITKTKVILYSFFLFTMTINMFITGGRAGHVMFFVALLILIVQVFSYRRMMGFIVALFMLPLIFLLAYNFSDLFNLRIHEAILNIVNYSEYKNTSVGQRITYAINTFEIIQHNFWLGVGTGDFPFEYSKVNVLNSSEVSLTTNPHNMYLLIMVQLGLVGLISMLLIFFYQIKVSLYSNNLYSNKIAFVLPVLFLIIMLSDSYLLGHYTTLLFVFFSSFLHKNFEEY